MQQDLRRLAKSIVKHRNKVPAPLYDGLRETYRKVNTSRYMKAPAEFDAAFYLQTNPTIDCSETTPYMHFLKTGHRDLRNPNADFDIVWYLQNYGHTFDVGKIDAFSHYLKKGKAKGYRPHPPRQVRFNKSFSRPLEANAQRACLFAGYDPDGRIDDYVLIYLKELAKYADVFYLADCEMPQSELSKLDGIVKDAWAMRHGAYDFGSYSALARDLVGWDTLAEYDEVVFANDSCYLVKPLGEVFTRMDASPCAWWGLQACKGIASTLGQQPFPVKEGFIDVHSIKSDYLEHFEQDPIYDFLVGSYFLAFRRDVINDVRFQRVMNAVQPEKRKLNIIQKNEIGITHFLIGHGYEFDTWSPSVTKAPAVYTEDAFDLLESGFPLFKKYLLAENHYRISSLSYWKTALTLANSVTKIDQIESNYLRTSNADKIYKSFNTVKDGVSPEPPMSKAAFHTYDAATPKYDHYWGFPVCVYDHTLSDNNRAVFEYVKNDPKITKIVFTRSRTIKLDGVNVVCVPLNSKEGQTYLARCRNIFVRHGANANIGWPVRSNLHNIINLWHGVPLKRIGTASLDLKDDRTTREQDNSRLRAVISASDVDRLAMTAAYAPKTYDDIWLTGLPRHDFITKPEQDLPEMLRAQLHDIRSILGGRKMILFCPTFRNDQENGYFDFSSAQISQLTQWLNDNDLIMGIREHPADKTKQYSSQLSGEAFVRVQAGRFPDVEMLYREAAILVTDYSSCFIDYMLTGRPMVSFAYDFEAYKERERGLFYELENVFPGPIAQSFDDLLKGLNESFMSIDGHTNDQYQAKRKFFLKYADSENSARVVNKTLQTYEGSKLIGGITENSVRKADKSITFLYSASGNITNRYRIFSLLPELQMLGWKCNAVDIDKADIHAVSKSSIVSFCRLQISTRALDFAETVRATGSKVIFDTDDLIHDPDIFFQSEYFRRDIKMANKLSLSSQYTSQMMMLADAFTLTTPALLESVKVFGKPAAIVENSISQPLLKKYAKTPVRRKDGQVHLSYLSGTATHSGDFKECKRALATVLNARPNVVLHVVGQLDVTDLAAEVEVGQVQKHGLMPYAAMHEFLRKMDLNLAPLTDNTFNDAKSALKIFEAALHGVPTIASPSEPYRNAIQDKKTGYLARTTPDWEAALFEAVDDTNKRHKIGDAARHKIVPLFRADVAAEQLSVFLNSIS